MRIRHLAPNVDLQSVDQTRQFDVDGGLFYCVFKCSFVRTDCRHRFKIRLASYPESPEGQIRAPGFDVQSCEANDEAISDAVGAR